MYTVIIEEVNKKSKKSVNIHKYILGEIDTDEYIKGMDSLGDYLYGLDIDFDDIDGDGDMEIDDILIAISEEEVFERELSNHASVYKIGAFFG